MQSVIISVGSEVEVEAPYDRRFHDAADELGGTPTSDGEAWRFSRNDEERVRQLCSTIFGEDQGTTPATDQPLDRSEVGTSEASELPVVSTHQRRADLLDRLDMLLDEVAEVHTALQALK
ncbi:MULTISPECIES: hypothetical protein [Nocardia]|uniref:Uncharacterized protein n=5 Tax=Nocardiaceae TaxID=85025 RepID=A0A7G1KIG2_9NOCA|nr:MULTISPECIES: hypothetical protein [Nocardia]MCP2287175.1 hypothetical protein [Nocardia amikacinitolerans]MBF6143000.1 hypothetical protein [Nocardia farcinica]MBF6271540.1 hypothetical protein [Nocardia farcinica]MBF6295491.1 hypothetical protein [Nocardia farcinica]MBF6362361.1 hypothetical protein [Nocardia farcinica]